MREMKIAVGAMKPELGQDWRPTSEDRGDDSRKIAPSAGRWTSIVFPNGHPPGSKGGTLPPNLGTVGPVGGPHFFGPGLPPISGE